MGTAINTALSIFRAQIGYHEKASNSELDDFNSNYGANNYTKFARDLDAIGWFYNGAKNGYAWCDVTFDWGIVTAFGAELALEILCQPKYSAGAGCLYSANYYKAAGRFFTSGPQVGDQIFYYVSGAINHTGFVEEVSGGNVITIEGNVQDMVQRCTHSIYDASIAGYGRPKYELVESGSTTTTTTESTTSNELKYGSKGSDVADVQTKLIALGYSCGADGADGDFGLNTSLAVQKFQRQKGLEVDAVVGPLTLAALNSAYESFVGTTTTSTTTVNTTSSVTTVEDMAWEYFMSVLDNPVGAAVMMGHAKAESSFIAKNVQDSYESLLGYTDDSYVIAVDSGAYTKFATDAAGFGLFQWTYWTRKQGLLNYAKGLGKSIADPKTQMQYAYKELQSDYVSTLNKLTSGTSIREVSDYVLRYYENPANQSTAVQEKRAAYAQEYYNTYYNGATTSAKTWSPKLGDIVNYNGSVHYVRSSGGTAQPCVGGRAKITNIASGAIHPYHLVRVVGAGATVFGWVDAGTLEEV